MLGYDGALLLRYPVERVREPLVFGVSLLGGGGALLWALWLIAGKWSEERMTVRAIGVVTLIYAGLAGIAMAQRFVDEPMPGTEALQLAITTLSFQGAVLILVRRLVQEHGLNWQHAFGVGRQWPRAVAIGFMSAVSILPVTWGLRVISVKAMGWLGLDPSVQHAVDIFSLTDAVSDRIVLGVAALVIAPVAEELLFRGVMYPALRGFGFGRWAFWITAAVFSLIHFDLATFLPLFAFACLLNVLYDRTGNLLACVAAHATFNAVNLIMLMVIFSD